MKRLRRRKQERKSMIMRTKNLSNKRSWLMKMRLNRPMKGKTPNTIQKMMESLMTLNFKNKIVYKKKMIISKRMRLMLSFKKQMTMTRKRMLHSRLRK